MSTPDGRTAAARQVTLADFAEARTKAKALWELGKPNLSLLVVVTAVIGSFLASSAHPDRGHGLQAFMLVVGTALTAMGACTANMCREAEIDALMHRTRNRPIPSGRVQDTEAFAWGLWTFLFGFALLYVFTGPLPAFLSAITTAIYAFVYTPSKRVGPISVWIGAIPGAIPPLMGWATVTGGLELGAFALFALMFTWQFPHFLALAFMYREDYARGGFRFLPETDTARKTGAHIGWGTVAVFVASLAPAALGLTGPLYLVVAALAGVGFMYKGWLAARGLTLKTARGAFFASIIYLPILLVAIVGDRLLAFSLLSS